MSKYCLACSHNVPDYETYCPMHKQQLEDGIERCVKEIYGDTRTPPTKEEV